MIELALYLSEFYWTHLGKLFVTTVVLAIVSGVVLSIPQRKFPNFVYIPLTSLIFCAVNMVGIVICAIWKFM